MIEALDYGECSSFLLLGNKGGDYTYQCLNTGV